MVEAIFTKPVNQATQPHAATILPTKDIQQACRSPGTSCITLPYIYHSFKCVLLPRNSEDHELLYQETKKLGPCQIRVVLDYLERCTMSCKSAKRDIPQYDSANQIIWKKNVVARKIV